MLPDAKDPEPEARLEEPAEAPQHAKKRKSFREWGEEELYFRDLPWRRIIGWMTGAGALLILILWIWHVRHPVLPLG